MRLCHVVCGRWDWKFVVGWVVVGLLRVVVALFVAFFFYRCWFVSLVLWLFLRFFVRLLGLGFLEIVLV